MYCQESARESESAFGQELDKENRDRERERDRETERERDGKWEIVMDGEEAVKRREACVRIGREKEISSGAEESRRETERNGEEVRKALKRKRKEDTERKCA